MISQKMLKDACIKAGATSVTTGALHKYQAWMERMLNDIAAKSVARMHADGRTTVNVDDIGE